MRSPPAPAAEAAGTAAPVARPGPLPPWLWVWAIAFLLIVPTILHNAWATDWAFWPVSWLPLDLQLPIAVIHGFVAAFELLPSLVFPAGYLASALIVLLMAYGSGLARGTTAPGLAAYLLHGIPFLLAGIWVQLATIGALLLLWPLLRPVWLRLIAGIRQRPSLEGASILAPAGALLLAAVVALDPLRPAPTLAEQFAAMIEPERPPLPEEGPAIRATKPVFVTGEPIVLWLRDLPGPLQNWGSVVAPDTPPDIYVDVPGHWAYTDDLVTGEIVMAPQLPGPCEARFYLDWPDGGTEIRGYDRFYVVSR